jgi:hypothetical protein
MSYRNSFFAAFLWGVGLLAGGTAYATDLIYFSNGDTPGEWQWLVQDPDNWYVPLEGNAGASASGKLTLGPSDSPEFPGAVKLEWKWTKSGTWAAAEIRGRTVDLSPYEHTGQLALVIKIEDRPQKDKHVVVKMKCGDKCEPEVKIHHQLKKSKTNEWFVFPVPLDCFAGANLKNIMSPLLIGTDGKLILHIAEVSIQKLPPGDEGCVPNPVAPAAPGTK